MILNGCSKNEPQIYAVEEVPLTQIAGDLASGALVHLLPQLDSSNQGIHMYYQQRTQMPLRVRHFIDFVIAAAPQLLRAYKRGQRAP